LEFESIITKKSNIIYKTHKLNLKKKSEQVSSSSQQQLLNIPLATTTTTISTAAYVVYLVITPCKWIFIILIPPKNVDSVSVIKESPNKLTANQPQVYN
jgi:hypothetical protein